MKKWISLVLLLAALAFVPQAFAETAAFPPELWTHIDGSTSLIPLSEAFFRRLTGLPDSEMAAYIEHTTTPNAYANIAGGGVNLILVTPPSAEEILSASTNGVELELIPIAKDALVMLCNVENPVTALTTRQLRDIYQGKITNWQAVGGADMPILPYQRSLHSGSQTLFLQLLMGDEEPMEPAKEGVLSSMGFLVDAISGYDNAAESLGYSMYYYISNMYGNDRLRMLTVDGVEPTLETIASGEYSMWTYYYAVLRADLPTGAPERALVEYIRSEAGQRIVEEAGYVPLAPLEEAP